MTKDEASEEDKAAPEGREQPHWRFPAKNAPPSLHKDLPVTKNDLMPELDIDFNTDVPSMSRAYSFLTLTQP